MKTLNKIPYLTVCSTVAFILLLVQGCVEIELPEGTQMMSKAELRLSNLLWEADIAYREGQYHNALGKCEEAFQTSKQVENQERFPYILYDIVESCGKLTEHEGLPPMSAELADLIAVRYSELEKQEKAKAILQEARKDAKEGEFQAAFDKLEEAQDMYESMVSEEKDWVRVELGLVVVMHSLSGEEEALVELEPRLLALIDRLGTEDRIVADWFSSLARAHEKLGQFEHASTYYERALALKREIGDERAEEFGVYHTGQLYEKQGLYEKALELYQQDRTQKKNAGDTKGEIESLHKVVWVYHQIPQYENALNVEQEILSLQETSASLFDIAMTLRRIGSIYEILGQYDNALKLYGQALSKYQEAGGVNAQSEVSQVLQSIAYLYKDLGQYGQAIALQEQALTLAAEAETMLMLQLAKDMELRYGDTLKHNADLQEKVIEFYRLAEAASQGKGQVVFYALVELADSYRIAGQPEKAEDVLLQTLANVRENAEHVLNPVKQKLAHAKEMAETEENQGKLESYQAQIKMYAEQLRISTIQKKSDEAYVLDKIGAFYEEEEAYEESLDFYEQALALYSEFQTPDMLGLRRSEAGALEHIGTVYVALGEYEKALSTYQEALDIHRELNENRNIVQDPWSEGHMLYRIGVAYEESGNYEQAVTLHRQALEISEKLGAPERIWNNHHAIGRSLAKWGKNSEALQSYEHALDMIESLRAGLTEKELKMAFMSERFHVYDELIEWLQTLHQQYPDEGYDRKALEIFERKQGRVFLEEMGQSGARFFAGLPKAISERQRALESQIPQTRKQLVDELVKPGAEQDRERIRNLQQREATLLSEHDALQETIKTEYPDYYALQYPQPVALSEIQTSVLQAGELMLVYSVMDTNTLLWVIEKNELELYALDIGEEALTAKVAELRQALRYAWSTERGLALGGQSGSRQDSSKQAQQKPASFVQASYELYTVLIPEAVRPLLNDQHTLNIVPTGPLYALPFEALLTRPAKDLSHARYVIEDIPISYLSSASLLNTLRKSQAQRTATAPYPLLVFADPAYSHETPEETDSVRALRSQSYRAFLGGGFSELPETADEAKAIAEVFNAPHESTPLQLRENASYAGVIGFNSAERLDDYQYLIFAMHGVLPGEVSHITQSALVLSDNYLTTADVFGLRLNAKLVSLSACNTGRGFQVKGEGVRGLTRAFMYAGTPAVAVTLWSVESLSAKDLDIGFFRHIKAGLPPVRALQAIKVQMLRGEGGKNYRHPYYWAPFVVFGDGM